MPTDKRDIEITKVEEKGGFLAAKRFVATAEDQDGDIRQSEVQPTAQKARREATERFSPNDAKK